MKYVLMISMILVVSGCASTPDVSKQEVESFHSLPYKIAMMGGFEEGLVDGVDTHTGLPVNQKNGGGGTGVAMAAMAADMASPIVNMGTSVGMGVAGILMSGRKYRKSDFLYYVVFLDPKKYKTESIAKTEVISIMQDVSERSIDGYVEKPVELLKRAERRDLNARFSLSGPGCSIDKCFRDSLKYVYVKVNKVPLPDSLGGGTAWLGLVRNTMPVWGPLPKEDEVVRVKLHNAFSKNLPDNMFYYVPGVGVGVGTSHSIMYNKGKALSWGIADSVENYAISNR